jgi:hypothetical protein
MQDASPSTDKRAKRSGIEVFITERTDSEAGGLFNSKKGHIV